MTLLFYGKTQWQVSNNSGSTDQPCGAGENRIYLERNSQKMKPYPLIATLLLPLALTAPLPAQATPQDTTPPPAQSTPQDNNTPAAQNSNTTFGSDAKDSKQAAKQNKKQEKANKAQAKADQQRAKADQTKAAKKADKAQEKANKEAEKAGTPPS
jgi:hypothetical protein